MQGIDSFIFTSDIQKEYRNKICSLILYGYEALKRSGNIYSKANIRTELKNLNKDPTKIPLEDYLTFDLVDNYLKPNRHIFGLEYIYISSQVSETSDNIEIGKIDIKFSELSDNSYVIVECKRLNTKITSNYIKDGIKRFTTKKYYPNIDQDFAVMIAYLESKPITKLIDSVNDYLNRSLDIDTLQYLEENSSFSGIALDSSHLVNKAYTISIAHLWLDYTSLIFD